MIFMCVNFWIIGALDDKTTLYTNQTQFNDPSINSLVAIYKFDLTRLESPLTKIQ